MTEAWTKEWERRIVNGVYPLRRFLGRSNHSVVFLTECTAQNIARAAIKILPADPALAEAQLAQWKTVATLSHPHLIRHLDTGRCQLGGHHFLFVVMEYAEQNLAQILPARPLTPDEVRELLPPTLDALAYLHGRSLVHGGLKPPNFLVVDDQLKLASDTIRPVGERTASTARLSPYDPPEASTGRAATSADIWGLGIMLVEALTQAPPAWSRERSDAISLPANLAPEFLETVQRCLDLDPGRRPAIAELQAQFNPVPAATASASPPAPSRQNSLTTGFPVAAIAVGIVALCAVWLGLRLFHTQSAPPSASTPSSPPLVSQHNDSPATPTPAAPAPAAAAPSAPSPAAGDNSKPAADTALPTVLHQELPRLSNRARESIHGIIAIDIRVIVDRSGNVVAATVSEPGASKYFARAARDAAKKWKFAGAVDQASRSWLLRFEFTRARTTATAAARG